MPWSLVEALPALSRPNGIASVLALTTSSLLIALAFLMDPYLIQPPPIPPLKAMLLDGDQYLFLSSSDADPVERIATFRKTARESNGFVLWNVSVLDPNGHQPGYEGVALFRHDRIAWRFMIELWLRPRPFELITDLLEDERVCWTSCFYIFRSDHHQLIPAKPYAQRYRSTSKPEQALPQL